MKYFSIGYAEAKALQDVEALRDIMYHFMDDHIQARVEKKLWDAKSIPELFKALKEGEEVFWPDFKYNKTSFKSKRKSGEDLVTYLAELR